MGHSQQQFFDHFGTTLALSAVITGAVATTAVVAAPAAGLKIRVLGWAVIPEGASTMTWLSAATAKTGVMKGSTGVPVVMPFNPAGWFDCAAAEALNFLVGTAAANGVLSYAIVKAAG